MTGMAQDISFRQVDPTDLLHELLQDKQLHFNHCAKVHSSIPQLVNDRPNNEK